MNFRRRSLWRRALLLSALRLPWAATKAQMVKIQRSSKAGDRLSAKPELQFSEARPAEGSTFEINDAVEYQKIDGFGASPK